MNILAIAAAFKTDRSINIFGRRQKKDKDRVSDYVDVRVEAAYKHHGIKRDQLTNIVIPKRQGILSSKI